MHQSGSKVSLGGTGKQVIPKADAGGLMCKEHLKFQALVKTAYPRNLFLKIRERYFLGLLLCGRLSAKMVPKDSFYSCMHICYGLNYVPPNRHLGYVGDILES